MKVGDYVRTKYGIFKIKKITKDLGYNKREKRVIELDRNIPEKHYRFQFYKDESIFKNAKYSKSIVALIKIGDYVNGFKVLEKYNYDNSLMVGSSYCKFIMVDDIKTIVTKEQFSQMEYRIGE